MPVQNKNPFLSSFIKLATVSERQAPPIESWPGMNRGSLSLQNCRQFNKATKNGSLSLRGCIIKELYFGH